VVDVLVPIGSKREIKMGNLIKLASKNLKDVLAQKN
jgi:hypothetical protein